MVLKQKKDYEEASEENAWRLLAEVSLSEERFQEVKALIFEAISSSIEEIDSVNPSVLEKPDVTHQALEDVDTLNKGSQRTMVSV